MSRDPRVEVFDRMLAYEDFRELIGGPPPNNDEAKIALMEHLYEEDAFARFEIRRIARRLYPFARVTPDPRETVMFHVARVVKRVVAALRPR